MTSSYGISGATNAPLLPLTVDSRAFGPETLLLFCSARLTTLDETIKHYFDQQQAKNGSMAIINKAATICGRIAVVDPEAMKDDKADHLAHKQMAACMASDLMELYGQTDNPALRAEIEGRVKDLTGRAIGFFKNADGTPRRAEPGDLDLAQMKKIEAPQWSQNLENLKSIQSEMSKGAEMNMMQLQSLVSQRQLAIQLTTQMLQTAHEGAKMIAGNIRA